MPFVATPFRRRLAMAVLLAAAVAGAVIRWQAPDPSTLRDIGTLMLVLWLPAVGNLIAFLVRSLPRRAPPPAPDFVADAPFAPHLSARLQPVEVPEGFAQSLDPRDSRATLVAANHGFSVRLAQPLAHWLASPSADPLPLQCLRPEAALRTLVPGMAVHLLAGTRAVATGTIAAHVGDVR